MNEGQQFDALLVRTADLRQGDRRLRTLITDAMGVRAGDRVRLEGLDGLWDVIYVGTPHLPIATRRVLHV